MNKIRFTKIIAVAGLMCLIGQNAKAQVLTDFVNHGVLVKVSESRGIMAVRDKAGTPLIVAIAHDQFGQGVRCSLLVIDAKTGKTEQYWYPTKEQANGDVYSLMYTRDGKIFTGIGNTFVEFDLEAREWTFSGEADGFAMAFTRTPDGNIYFGTYPKASLYQFNPTTRELKRLAQLDPQQQYPTYIEADKDGWVYSGLGTSRANLVAYNPATGERKQLLEEATRKTGTSYVFATADGIYGREFGSDAGRLMKLEGGTATFVEGNPANPTRAKTGAINWGNMSSVFPDGGAIASFSLPGKTAEVLFNGKKERINFDYETNGPGATSIAVGPNNKIYGSTNHPMHLFSFDPAKTDIVDHGTIPAIGGGNFGAFGSNGKYLVGGSYSFGTVYEFDTTQPWNAPATGDPTNPRPVGTFKDVSRPRASVTLPNGDILFGGYPAYGVTGGGLVTYSAVTREAKLKPAAELLPNHSTVALELLNPQTVVGGTSIETPGGGVVMAKEAELYLLDTATQTVTFRTVPVAGARSILDVHVAPDGKVYGLTNSSQFFVFDPQTKEVVQRADWTEYGVAFNPGNSMWNTPNGRVGVLFPKVLLEIQPDYSVRKLANTPAPATTGIALLSNRLYFATGSHLRSVGLAPLAP
ncbi:MAG TPA: hypothetical protein VF681_00605 [Abditibacteriaceae bacterium]|jgi:hypothetical protein